jgi:hypothetical protein
MDDKTKVILGVGLLATAVVIGGIALFSKKAAAKDGVAVSFSAVKTADLTYKFTPVIEVLFSACGWEFGDGDTSIEDTPTHVYDAAGTYKVKLTITDLLGESLSVIKSIAVKAGAVVPVPPGGADVLDVSISSPNEGLKVMFDAIVSGGAPPYKYAWDLGDGAKSTLASFDHTYVGTVGAGVKIGDVYTKTAADLLVHPTNFTLGKANYTWEQWMNHPLIVSKYALFHGGEGAVGGQQKQLYYAAVVWAHNTLADGSVEIEYAAQNATYQLMTLSDFAMSYLVGLATLAAWAGAGTGGAPKPPLTFAGTVTLVVTDSAGNYGTASEYISVAGTAV